MSFSLNVSAPSRKRKASSDEKNGASKVRHLVNSPKIQAKENSTSSGQSSRSSSQSQPKASDKTTKTAPSADLESGDVDKEKMQMKEKEEKDRHKIKPKEKEKAQNLSQLESENGSKEKGKEKDSSKNKQRDMKCLKNDSDTKTGEKELKKKEEQKSVTTETKEVLEKEKEVKTVETVCKKVASPKSKETLKDAKKDSSKKETGKKEMKKKALEIIKGQGKVIREKVKPVLGEKKTDTEIPMKKEAKQSVRCNPTETKSSKNQELPSSPAEKMHQKQARDVFTGKDVEGNDMKNKSTQKKSATQVKSKRPKVGKSSRKETKQMGPAVKMEQDENEVQVCK